MSEGESGVESQALPRSPEPWEQINFGEASFRESKAIIDLVSRGVKIPEEFPGKARERMIKLIGEAEQLGVFEREVKRPFLGRIRGVDWDNLQEELWALGDNLNSSILNRGYPRKLDGVIPYVMEGAYARLVQLGIDQADKSDDLDWLEEHGYSQKIIEELEREAVEKQGELLVRPGTERSVGYEERKRRQEERQYVGENPEVRRLQEQVENQRRKHERLYQRMMDFLDRQIAVQPQRPQQSGMSSPEDWARMMGQGTPEEQRELYLRAEEVMYPMQMQLQVPNFLLNADPKIRAREQREWRARAALASMAANKRMAPSYDKQFSNQDQIDFTAEHLVDIVNINGALDVASFYTYCIAENADISFLHIRDVSVGGDIRSIFQIKTIQQFVALREGVRDRAVANRHLSEQEARDAEHVAWNLVYSSNVVEEYDSVYENGLSDRIPPTVPQLKALSIWMMMHPQERLAMKAGDPNNPNKVQEAMGSLGEWAVNRTKKTRGRLDVDVLPRTMFENALKGISVSIHGEEITLFELFRRNGEFLFAGGDSIDPGDISWGSVEVPFSGYQFDTISPAIKIFDVVMKGEGSGVDASTLANVCRKLGLSKAHREILLMLLVSGVKRDSVNLTPLMGRFDWRIFKNEFKRIVPSFFE